MAVFEGEKVANNYYWPFIDVGRRVLTLAVDYMLSKVPLAFEGSCVWVLLLSY